VVTPLVIGGNKWDNMVVEYDPQYQLNI
jgi:hypothetical protein